MICFKIEDTMYKIKALVVVTLFSLCICHNSIGQTTLKIVCIGDDLTYGVGAVNSKNNNYASQLGNLLGSSYEVTKLKLTDQSKSNNGKPNIVVVEFGKNGINLFDTSLNTSFEQHTLALIQSIKQSPAHPRIILLLPTPYFALNSIKYNSVTKNQLIPLIQKIAYTTGVEILDIYSLFLDRSDLSTDQTHPNSLGATLIAKRVYELIKLNTANKVSIFSKIKEKKSSSSFYGYECINFAFNNRNCKIVQPKKVVKGMPWVWRARFWGHEPQTDIALLERGFHIVYADVAELYGNQEAVSIWNQFYTYMRQLGLAKKVVLEGMSRGGIYVYNWALQNPEKVAAVYVDAPVLDLKSWPGGKGKAPGSKVDWDLFKSDYHLSEEQALVFNNSPLDNANIIAKGGYPMLHVVGDADEVVPVEEHTNPFELKVKAAGGKITVIHKPKVGHHPHSLENPTPIVDFILNNTGNKTNFAVIASPGAEYRSAAGWIEGTDWWVQNDDINQLLKANKKLDIIFLGNSITQGIGGNRPNVTYKAGKVFFDQYFEKQFWVCAGISGDRTQHILWRLQNGNYASAKPKLVVLAIGVNNFQEDSGEETASGIKLILNWMKSHMPATKIILIGPLPTGLTASSSNRIKYEVVHSIIKKEASKQVTYLPLSKYFIKQNGELDTTYCAGDGIHLIAPGYELWAKVLKEAVDKMNIK
jgi:lysophospholipase L1-like esterase/pimeloyl-ACP methyl ester carboxylesterase